MLRKNTNVSKGLCNGRIGTITNVGITTSGYVNNLYIRFDGDTIDTKIERVSAQYEIKKNIIATRKQFPIILAWAITIHKSQGLTLNKALIDLGDSVFAPGMAYVALSRLKKLNDLILIDFNPRVLICNELAIKEYNRLSKLFQNNTVMYLEYNVLPEKYDRLPKCNYEHFKKRHLVNELEENIDDYEQSSKKIKSTVNSDVDSKFYYLKLLNYGRNSCFINVLTLNNH